MQVYNKINQNKYYLKNKKEILKKQKLYKKNNPDKTLEIQRRYRENNYKEIRERNQQRYDKKRQYINDYKLTKGCSICGYNKCAFVLDFHHDKGKNYEIPRMANSHNSMERLKEEIKNCIVLCANCHRELHDKENIINGKFVFEGKVFG